MTYWLGIDIGTGGSRALLVDASGDVVAGVTEAHPDIQMQRPLWAEQHPEDGWKAARTAIREVLAKAGWTGAVRVRPAATTTTAAAEATRERVRFMPEG